MTSPDTELDNFNKLNGGQKHMWLENHREFILDFYNDFGEATTRKTFNLKGDTLHNLLIPRMYTRTNRRISTADRALAQTEIVKADLKELRKEVKLLTQLFERFQQSVGEQLIDKFFLPLLQSRIQIDKDLNLPQKEELRIDNIDLKQLAIATKKTIRKK